ncbi:MAG: class I SAM-dependent methyltransferase [Mariprofundus sp.]|nr:class I SAM-dependent methyltransferase [Mariprofundus sp.]
MSAVELLYQTATAKAEGRTLIINTQADSLLLTLSAQCPQLDLQQHFKPEYAAIQRMGLAASETLSGFDAAYDLIVLLAAKNKQQTLGWMAEAMKLLQDNGILLMACANKHGAKSYESALHMLAGNIASRCQSKCRIFSAKKTALLDHILLDQWVDSAQAKSIPTHGLISQPGLFSWNHADSGSQLLLDHLPHDFSGTGMDLCCGYGLLAEHLLHTSPDIDTLHLVEADQLALNCAEYNTRTWAQKIQSHWRDAAHDPLPKQLDWIICNPPFHTGQQRDVGLGQGIVQRACQSLKRGGRLYVVANRKLPYEALMHTGLKHCDTVVEADGFKIIKGIR